MENQTLTKKNIIIVIVAAVAAVLMIAGIYITLRVTRDNETGAEVIQSTSAQTTANETISDTHTVIDAESYVEFISTKDFAALKEKYPDCYAWIEIPGSYISYPIIQHPTDDSYYLRKNAAGEYDECGCIFTEHQYNSNDFSDPVTLIYGHYVYMNNEYKFFGGLQTMYKNDLTEYGKIIIYLPDKELHYEVFAAVPYHTYHILYGEDYSTEQDFNEFLDGVKSIKAFDANVNTDYDVSVGDNLIVLSTCYNGRPNGRFIVIAKLVETIE